MSARRAAPWALLLLLGLVLGARGAWIPAKAWLGQRLLERAWQLAETGAQTPRPWPWADSWPVARLRAPRQGVTQVVLEGATGPSLAWAPGRHTAGARIGGDGHIVLAGHRDTHFRFLARVLVGDALVLQAPGGRRFRYRVVETRVVHESDTRWLAERGVPSLTLLTCHPFDTTAPGGPERYLVVAERVAPERAGLEATS